MQNTIHSYKYIKDKLFKTNVAISYNNMCQINELTPKYIKTYSLSFLPGRHSPQWAKASSLSRIHDHTQTHHIL